MSTEKDISTVDADQPSVVAAEDRAAPSPEVSSKRQRLSDLVTIIAAGAGLASDGYVYYQSII